MAVTTVERDAAIDPILTGAMDNPRERVNVLRYEDAMVQFMKAGTKQQQLELSPNSSYHRLVLYRLAHRFGLHGAAEGEVGADAGGNRSVKFFKTPQSSIPHLLLIDTCGKEGVNGSGEGSGSGSAKAPVMRLMQRRRTPGGDSEAKEGAVRGKGSGEEKTSSTVNGARSVIDREKAYAEARARIFGSSSSTTASTSSPSPTRPLDSKGKTANPSNGAKLGLGRTSRAGSPAADGLSTPPPSAGPGLLEEGARSSLEEEARKPRGGAGEQEEKCNGGKMEWGESKVLWRNREAERYDPDFVRHRPPRGLGGGDPYGPGGRGAVYGVPPQPPYGAMPGMTIPSNPALAAYPPASYAQPHLQMQLEQHQWAAYHQHPQAHHQGAFLAAHHPPHAYYNDPRYASQSPHPYQQGGGGRGRGRADPSLRGPSPPPLSRALSEGSDVDLRQREDEFPPLSR